MIHASAIIEPGAQVHASVKVGPFSWIGPNVTLGEGCEVDSHVKITGHTTIGKRNRFASFAAIGGPPQDKKYAGEPTRLDIGDDNTFRESVTVNTGTAQAGGVTRIGNNNWVMAYVHIAHDCQIGSHCVFANAVTLAGHVHVGDHVVLGGLSGAHQFCRIGAHAMAGGMTLITQDVAPYVMISGVPAATHGINSEGLKRRGFSADQIASVKAAYKTIFKSGKLLSEALAELRSLPDPEPALQPLIEFMSTSGRGFIR